MPKVKMLDYLKSEYAAGNKKGKAKAGKYFSVYRQYVALLFMLGLVVCFFFGFWLYALLFWLAWHFHMLIAENYWQTKSLQLYLIKQEQKKNEVDLE